MKLLMLFLGGIFGFALTMVRASEYDMIYRMFVGSDLTVAWVIISAIIVGLLGMQVVRAAGGRTRRGDPIQVSKKPLTPIAPIGAALFGVGWGLSGACPGTVLAQIGSGRLLGLFTLSGMLVGTYVYAIIIDKRY